MCGPWEYATSTRAHAVLRLVYAFPPQSSTFYFATSIVTFLVCDEFILSDVEEESERIGLRSQTQ